MNSVSIPRGLVSGRKSLQVNPKPGTTRSKSNPSIVLAPPPMHEALGGTGPTLRLQHLHRLGSLNVVLLQFRGFFIKKKKKRKRSCFPRSNQFRFPRVFLAPHETYHEFFSFFCGDHCRSTTPFDDEAFGSLMTSWRVFIGLGNDPASTRFSLVFRCIRFRGRRLWNERSTIRCCLSPQ